MMHMLLFPASDFGMFLSDEDPKKGVWLENGRTLEYYLLRNGVGIQQRTCNEKKTRTAAKTFIALPIQIVRMQILVSFSMC